LQLESLVVVAPLAALAARATDTTTEETDENMVPDLYTTAIRKIAYDRLTLKAIL
jgi:hypothetical protein